MLYCQYMNIHVHDLANLLPKFSCAYLFYSVSVGKCVQDVIQQKHNDNDEN